MFLKGNVRYIEAELRTRVADILALLNASVTLEDLEIPGFRLHELSGNLKGVWSIAVTANWRITFRFVNGNAEDVDLTIIIKGRDVMIMKNPPHPGGIVRRECLDPLGLSVAEAAKVLGVTRQALNNLVSEKVGVSAEMAVRLAKAFGSSPDMWLRLQVNYDLAQIAQDEIQVTRYKKAS